MVVGHGRRGAMARACASYRVPLHPRFAAVPLPLPEWIMRLETRLQIGLVEAELTGLFQRVGAQARGAEFADDIAVLALVEVLELEQFLGADPL